MHKTAINGTAKSVETKTQNDFPFSKALKKQKKTKGKAFFTPPRLKERVGGEEGRSPEAYISEPFERQRRSTHSRSRGPVGSVPGPCRLPPEWCCTGWSGFVCLTGIPPVGKKKKSNQILTLSPVYSRLIHLKLTFHLLVFSCLTRRPYLRVIQPDLTPTLKGGSQVTWRFGILSYSSTRTVTFLGA